MRLLSTGPRVRKVSNRIIATTALKLQILLLGTIYRKVIVDPRKKKFLIRTRYLWFFNKKRVVRFPEIKSITYGYTDFAPGASLSFSHDSIDHFSVGLRLHDDEELTLFTFGGEGTFSNNGPFPDWFYWDDFAFDFSGSQQRESEAFVELLAEMTQTTVVPPTVY